MSDFTPPRGQGCETCRHFGSGESPHGKAEDACWAFGTPTDIPRREWCIYWRASAALSCGGCAHYAGGWWNAFPRASTRCPRAATVVVREGERAPYYDAAFPCDRYEEAEP